MKSESLTKINNILVEIDSIWKEYQQIAKNDNLLIINNKILCQLNSKKIWII